MRGQSDSLARLNDGLQQNVSLACTLCGKTYSRIDHLERHHRSHTQVKPFSCRICGKVFARADVLKRHAANHSDESPAAKKQRRDTFPQRSRVGKACYACAAAKLKCEDEKPCRRCQQKRIPCTYSSTNSPSQNDADNPVIDGQDQEPESSPRPQIRRGRLSTFETQAQLSSDLNAYHADSQTAAHHGHHPVEDGPTSGLTSNGLLPGAEDMVQDMHDTRPLSSPEIQAVFDESSLADFLNDIMLPFTPMGQGQNLPNDPQNQPRTPRDFLDFGTAWIDFSDLDAMMPGEVDDFEVMPMPMPPRSNNIFAQLPPASGTKTPIFSDGMRLVNDAFSRSIWRWTPTKKDHGGADQLNLSLPYPDMESPETRSMADSSFSHHRVDSALRDKILALVLGTCERASYPDVVSSFPSAELLTNLMQFYMTIQSLQNDSWLHLPTFQVSEQSLELIIMLVSAGASLCSVPAIRRLGFALQEAVRVAVAQKFESDNRFTRDLRVLQAFALQLQVGLWSGDKRKMEIAESFAQPLITMMRRGGQFRRPRNAWTPPSLDESEEVLEMKWYEWAESESWKRFACHVLIHDAQSSMAHQMSPLLSPAEISLEFPVSKELWSASTAQEWRTLYAVHLSQSSPDKTLSISQGIYNAAQLRHQPNLDVPLAATIIAYSVWAVVWNHSQLLSLVGTPPSGGGGGGQEQHTSAGPFLSASPDSKITSLLDQLRMIFLDWGELFRPEIALVFERTLLNLHVSFEQVQLFAGKEGEEEARRVFPILRQWAAGSDARKAVWHAGQVLKAASQSPSRYLHDFGAICLYHAGITFWAYAIVSAAGTQDNLHPHHPQQQQPLHFSSNTDLVWLDGDDCPAVQRFIGLKRGNPVITDWRSSQPPQPPLSAAATSHPHHHLYPSPSSSFSAISLSNPKAVMDICIDLLRKNSSLSLERSGSGNSNGQVTPLVENLSQLMRDLSNAAQSLLRGHLKRARDGGGGTGGHAVAAVVSRGGTG